MLIDITQELFHCRVYPGDPQPERIRLLSLENGDSCNLTGLRMCAHNGTHVDAPCHFVPNGKTIDEMGLEPFVGDCFVARHEGDVLASDADSILRRAADAGAAQRILIAGKATVTEEAAGVFASALILLGAECVLLEGIVLDGVEEGRYFLSAAPLNLGGCEGAPCRAYLIPLS